MGDDGSVIIKSVFISNFRGINQLDAPVEFGSMSFFIGDNGTGKTSLLEAVNFCLSSGYVASRLDLNDFHNGSDKPIEIVVTFHNRLVVTIPDGFTSQKVLCDKVRLFAKKKRQSGCWQSFFGPCHNKPSLCASRPAGGKWLGTDKKRWDHLSI